MKGRGSLTEKAREIARGYLKREISQTELRLYAYLDYVMKNSQKIDPKQINEEERKLLSILRSENHITGGTSEVGITITREFYDYIQDILFETYVYCR